MITIPVPNGGTPSPVAMAGTVPIRVLARAVVGTTFLAFDSSELTQTVLPGGATYSLPVTAADVFVLQPKQKLYAIANAAGVILSVSISEALPIKV